MKNLFTCLIDIVINQSVTLRGQGWNAQIMFCNSRRSNVGSTAHFSLRRYKLHEAVSRTWTEALHAQYPRNRKDHGQVSRSTCTVWPHKLQSMPYPSLLARRAEEALASTTNQSISLANNDMHVAARRLARSSRSWEDHPHTFTYDHIECIA